MLLDTQLHRWQGAWGRAASKDAELENTYLSLLKESSPHEKAITRDLGRFDFLDVHSHDLTSSSQNLSSPQFLYRWTGHRPRTSFQRSKSILIVWPSGWLLSRSSFRCSSTPSQCEFFIVPVQFDFTFDDLDARWRGLLAPREVNALLWSPGSFPPRDA